MLKAVITEMNVMGGGKEYSIGIVETFDDAISCTPEYPVKHWKTRKGAERHAAKAGYELITDAAFEAMREGRHWAYN